MPTLYKARLQFLASCLPLLLQAAPSYAQGLTRPKDVAIEAHVVVTKPVAATPERIAALKLPPGFHISKWAESLDMPRVIAIAPNGDVYVSSSQAGTVTLLRGGERATERRDVLKKKDVMGLTIHNGTLFYATTHEIFAAPMKPDGSLGAERTVAKGLPDVGQHNDRTLAYGPDGWLYASIGSTCNECDEQNPESATMLRVKPDGSGREVFASGLRNTIGFGFQPGSGKLYGWDDGVDWLGDDAQREELNQIEQGKKYGWPYVFGAGQLNYYRDPPRGQGSIEKWDKDSVRPALTFTAHSSGMQMVFYSGKSFPADYHGDILQTLHGSWNRQPPSGFEIVRVHFDHGQPKSITPFASGFMTASGDKKWERFARPFGLAEQKDGSLLMSEDQNGIIYRISYAK